jgi:hypothetical protein
MVYGCLSTAAWPTPLAGFVRIKARHEGCYGRCRVCRNRRALERYRSRPKIRAAEIARSSRNQGYERRKAG